MRNDTGVHYPPLTRCLVMMTIPATMLKQVLTWSGDNTGAFERVFIQRSYSYFRVQDNYRTYDQYGQTVIKKLPVEKDQAFPGSRSAQRDNDKIFSGGYLMNIGINLATARLTTLTGNVYALTEEYFIKNNTMRYIVFFILTAFATTIHAQHSLEKIWETDTVVAVPESVLPANGILYVSLIDGGGWEADGKGGVAKLSLDGKILDNSWITGLNAPKGLGIVGNRLYIADITEVVVVDIAKGGIEKKIAIDSAKNLNDITVGPTGTIYVSDSRTGRIWQLQNDLPVLYLENMKGVNGLKAVGDELLIASGKSFIKADNQKNTTPIADLPQGGDGVEPVGNGDFIVTAWVGYIFYVYADGKIETLLETHQQKKNTADIGYDPEKRILYVPSFNGKTVAAYLLK